MKLHLNIASPAVQNTVRVARIKVRRCVGRFVTPAKSAKFGASDFRSSSVPVRRRNVEEPDHRHCPGRTRPPSPVSDETHSMPTQDGLGPDDGYGAKDAGAATI